MLNPPVSPKRILVVGMLDSIHLARWLRQFENCDYHFYLLGSSPHRRIHPDIRGLLSSCPERFRVVGVWRFVNIAFWIADRFMRDALRGRLFAKLVNQIKPSIVHAIEFQNAGYLVAAGMNQLRSRPHLIATNYGSDISFFFEKSRHKSRILEVLNIADSYSCECYRDVKLVTEIGFQGEILPVIPNAGGLPTKVFESGRVERTRDTLAIKGYQGWSGRAKLAVDALSAMSDDLRGLSVVFFSCDRVTLRSLRRLKKETGLEVTGFGKGALSHEDMLSLFLRSRVYIGLSVSDGISTSMLEAMAAGAIPVQSSSACCDEWFMDSGVAVRELSAASVATAIRRGLEISNRRENVLKNIATVQERANERLVREISFGFYSDRRLSEN